MVLEARVTFRLRLQIYLKTIVGVRVGRKVTNALKIDHEKKAGNNLDSRLVHNLFRKQEATQQAPTANAMVKFIRLILWVLHLVA